MFPKVKGSMTNAQKYYKFGHRETHGLRPTADKHMLDR